MIDDYHRERRRLQAAWEALDEDERGEIIAWYDDLDAQGRLEDAPFYEQWIALRRKAID